MSSKLKSQKTFMTAANSKCKASNRQQAAAAAGTSKSSSATTVNKQQRFSSNNPIQSSPFKSFITTGLRKRSQSSQSKDFAYDLSKDEITFMNDFKSPMKAVPEQDRELLTNGQREAYLARRYEYTPDRKYNYPEATSWRIGWLHNQQIRPRS